jgi:hypothetical protein
LAFFTADLTADGGWREAVAGCDYVLHVASPLSTSVPKDENEMIIPARDGTLRVLRAARDAGVKRVVVTSSLGAIGYGHPPREKPFDETEWTNLAGADVLPYIKSKTLAERAAWDFIAREGVGLEMSVLERAPRHVDEAVGHVEGNALAHDDARVRGHAVVVGEEPDARAELRVDRGGEIAQPLGGAHVEAVGQLEDTEGVGLHRLAHGPTTIARTPERSEGSGMNIISRRSRPPASPRHQRVRRARP